MRYIKKMCILRQAKQGFSDDGKSLSGLIKTEQYGKNLAVEVSIINFAPLSSGEYYCILADAHGRVEMLALRGKSIFNILTDIDTENGFCAIVCFVKNDVVPIAYGVNGDNVYDWKKILSSIHKNSPQNTAPPVGDTAISQDLKKEYAKEATPPTTPTPPPIADEYNDEKLAIENYYQEQENGQELLQETHENALSQSATKKQTSEERTNLSQDVDDESVLHPFTTESDGYYRSVKAEIDELLQNYPKDDTLLGAFSCSEWVRVKGEKDNPKYLVGIVYQDGKARYICYALYAEDKTAPPKEIKDVCAFVPSSLFDEDKGFFVIFQSAATGECVKPFRV